MINSYSGFYTITQGLQVEQLLENITASNLANPSVDSNGYLVSSLQQVNLGTGPSEILSTANGNIAVSSGRRSSRSRVFVVHSWIPKFKMKALFWDRLKFCPIPQARAY